MKKTRLLEIIREEIDTAINEIPVVADNSELEIEKPSKYKQLSEKYQIDEEVINEMASIAQTVKGLKALGDEEEANEMLSVAQKTLNQFKKDPNISSGRLSRNLKPDESPNKKKRTIGYSTEFLKNYKAETGKDFDTVTYDIEARYKKQFPGEEPPFKSPGIAVNTVDKNAAKKITGVTPSEETPKSDSKKEKEEPKSEPKAKSEPKSEPKPEPKAKEKPEDEEKADKAVGTEKKVEKAAREQDKITAEYKKEVLPKLKDKIKKSKEGDKEAMSWLKSKQDIIKKYKEAQKI